MMTWFESLGIGSYYLRYFALNGLALGVAAALVWKFRRRLPRAATSTATTVILILTIRLIALDNPLALRFYQRHLTTEDIGVRQWGVLDLDIQNYQRRIHQPPIANLAVGSSQVGAIFSHWSPPTLMPLEVFSVAGMKTPDLWLYRHEIAARNPERVILYLSAFDLTAGQEVHVWPLAPAHPLGAWLTLSMLRSELAAADAAAAHAFIASQLIPEFRASYIFRAFLKRWTDSAARGIARVNLLPVAAAAAVRAPAAQAAAVDEAARQRQFVSYYLPEWLDYNYRLLRSFVAFCRERNIEVLIVEGQVNPMVKSEKLETLADMVRSRFLELNLIYDNVRIVWARDSHVFTAAEYRDYTHVKPEAARVFTRMLAGQLPPPPPVLSVGCDLVFGNGWHATEGGAADWLRWSSGNGAIRIRSREPGAFLLTGDILSLTRPNVVDVVVNGAIQASVDVRDLAWTFHPMPPLRLSLDGGNDEIVQLISRAPAVIQANDPRRLAMAVRHLSLVRADGVTCDVRR